MDSRVREIIDNSQKVVFFGGAGVSTESNIPDFRSEAGLYNAMNDYGYPPEIMLSRPFFMKHTETFYDYYKKNKSYPDIAELKEKLNCFRDLIAYRIVISMPRCHLKNHENREEEELKHLYQIANVLPQFLEERGFTAEPTGGVLRSSSPLLDDAVKPYYRDYITSEKEDDYKSLHITFYDNSARCYVEMQLRTKQMDDIAEIGSANHINYEKKQEASRARRDTIPEGECIYFDEAYERCRRLQELELSGVDVDMFTAVSNSLMNDGCGLYRGRLILPYEHLSRFQNDLID